MKEKVLIVEDEYVEANYLRSMLQRGGYTVCGAARSVEKARELIASEKPGLVLLDITLSGKLTGIDLAKELKEQGIAFVYLSANSNENTLNEAKLTEPYGFLVKPFRENDLLITLEIARYRHEHSLETKLRKEAALQKLLEQIVTDEGDWKSKLLDIGRCFQSYIPSDLMGVPDLHFLRVGFDEYQMIGATELSVISGSSPKRSLRETFQLESHLSFGLRLSNGEEVVLSFYSRRADVYTREHHALLNRIQPVLVACLNAILPYERAEAVADGAGNAEKRSSASGLAGIVGKSHLLLNVFDLITQVSPADTSVLILGESGTGKEMIASTIHKLSLRKAERFVKVNCAALPPSLIESELFGHEKGAFTGAMDKRVGKFEQANGGTIFLDEIGEMPLELQAKLLHVLQDKEIERIGARAPIRINVRVIAATNRNLEKEVAEGRFRLDLYYRLNVFPVILPPLRERKEDIAELCRHFIAGFNERGGKKIAGISERALKSLMAYHWPGNVRELENWVERHALLAKGGMIEDVLVPAVLTAGAVFSEEPAPLKTIQDNERDHIISVLRKCNGRVWGPGGAAEILNLPPTTLRSRMKKLGIQKGY